MTISKPRLVSVMYHYIRDVDDTPFPRIKAVSIKDFRRQVVYLKENCDTPSLEACIEFLEGKWVPRRDIGILTFDDGLREHYETVADILASTRTPAAFFLTTAALEENEVLTVHMNHFLLATLGASSLRRHIEDTATAQEIKLPADPQSARVRAVYRWDDDETAHLKYLLNHQLSVETSEKLVVHVFSNVLGSPAEFARSLYINWNQAAQLQAAGFAVGGHTHRHKVLSALSDHEQWDDLEASLHLLKRRLGGGARPFAYPYGKPSTYTRTTIGQLKALGYSCAFNTIVAHGGPGTSRWEVPRLDPKDSISLR